MLSMAFILPYPNHFIIEMNLEMTHSCRSVLDGLYLQSSFDGVIKLRKITD